MSSCGPCGETQVTELRGGEVSTQRWHPKQLGLGTATLEDLAGGDPEACAATMTAVLGGEAGPCREIVVLNAGAAIYVGGRAWDVRGGIDIAEESIDSGAARGKLEGLIEVSNA